GYVLCCCVLVVRIVPPAIVIIANSVIIEKHFTLVLPSFQTRSHFGYCYRKPDLSFQGWRGCWL
uniref:Uncharacterized protein n=1 Tax=Parascaris univalens TaxID=6257 RepID=A0A915CB44_PARUN